MVIHLASWSSKNSHWSHSAAPIAASEDKYMVNHSWRSRSHSPDSLVLSCHQTRRRYPVHAWMSHTTRGWEPRKAKIANSAENVQWHAVLLQVVQTLTNWLCCAKKLGNCLFYRCRAPYPLLSLHVRHGRTSCLQHYTRMDPSDSVHGSQALQIWHLRWSVFLSYQYINQYCQYSQSTNKPSRCLPEVAGINTIEIWVVYWHCFTSTAFSMEISRDQPPPGASMACFIHMLFACE